MLITELQVMPEAGNGISNIFQERGDEDEEKRKDETDCCQKGHVQSQKFGHAVLQKCTIQPQLAHPPISPPGR
ncbi:MAG: hypothetical protein JRE23_07420 [Deltaproteobacteria bacterium]|nr:hypothetical protein [Deltaproteobacteria bacterium]